MDDLEELVDFGISILHQIEDAILRARLRDEIRWVGRKDSQRANAESAEVLKSIWRV